VNLFEQHVLEFIGCNAAEADLTVDPENQHVQETLQGVKGFFETHSPPFGQDAVDEVKEMLQSLRNKLLESKESEDDADNSVDTDGTPTPPLAILDEFDSLFRESGSELTTDSEDDADTILDAILDDSETTPVREYIIHDPEDLYQAVGPIITVMEPTPEPATPAPDSEDNGSQDSEDNGSQDDSRKRKFTSDDSEDNGSQDDSRKRSANVSGLNTNARSSSNGSNGSIV